MRADIVIVGAGMVGSTLALALARAGLETWVVDAGPVDPAPFAADAPLEPRVSALSCSSQRILEQLGCWSGILARRATPYTGMTVWDGTGTGEIHFSAAAVHAPVLGHIVENRVIQDALLEQLAACPQVTRLGHVQLEALEPAEGGGWQLMLSDGRYLQARLVIAADGAHSRVRQQVGFATREWDYFHHAIVTSVRCQRSHAQTAWQRFTEHGPLAFLPLQPAGDDRWCSIVWSLPPAEAESLMALDDQAFARALEVAFESRLGAIEQVDPRMCVPLRQRHGKRYVQPGVALIGDAAHTIHPLAGQGVNLGLLDAAVLAEELIQAAERGEDLDSLPVLTRFERRRMPHNLSMMAAMESLERLFQIRDPLLCLLRNFGLRRVEGQADLKALFVRQALGLSGDLPQLARVG